MSIAGGLKIEPGAYYDEQTLRIAGIDGDRLAEARGRGELRYSDRAGKVMYKGAWIIAWLDSSDQGVGTP